MVYDKSNTIEVDATTTDECLDFLLPKGTVIQVVGIGGKVTASCKVVGPAGNVIFHSFITNAVWNHSLILPHDQRGFVVTISAQSGVVYFFKPSGRVY